MLTLDELDRMSRIGIDEDDRTKLVDIREIKIDPLQSAMQRMESYLDSVKNPYHFLCGDTAVHVCFEQGGKDLGSSIKNYFTSLKMG